MAQDDDLQVSDNEPGPALAVTAEVPPGEDSPTVADVRPRQARPDGAARCATPGTG